MINVNFSLFYSSFVGYSCLILFIKFLVGEVQISACTHLLIWGPQLSLSLGKFFFYIIKVYIIIYNWKLLHVNIMHSHATLRNLERLFWISDYNIWVCKLQPVYMFMLSISCYITSHIYNFFLLRDKLTDVLNARVWKILLEKF